MAASSFWCAYKCASLVAFYASVDFYEGDKFSEQIIYDASEQLKTFGQMERRFRCAIKPTLSKLTKIETDERKCGTWLCRGHVVVSHPTFGWSSTLSPESWDLTRLVKGSDQIGVIISWFFFHKKLEFFRLYNKNTTSIHSAFIKH